MMPPARTVRLLPPMLNAGEPEANAMLAASQLTLTTGASLAPVPKARVAVPLLAGTRLVSQLRAVVQLLSAPPESQTSAMAGPQIPPTASASTIDLLRIKRTTLHLLKTALVKSDVSPLKCSQAYNELQASQLNFARFLRL